MMAKSKNHMTIFTIIIYCIALIFTALFFLQYCYTVAMSDGADFSLANFPNGIALFVKFVALLTIITVTFWIFQHKTFAKKDKSERAMETLTSNIPGGVIRVACDRRGTLTYVSEGFYTLTGYSDDDISRKYENSFSALIFEEDFEGLIKNLERQLQNGNCFAMEYRLRKKNGELIWVLQHGQLVMDEFGVNSLYVVLVDITASKEFQQKLEISEGRYRALMEITDSIVYDWDITSDCVNFSEVWANKFGYSLPHEGFTENLQKLNILHPDDMEKYSEMIASAKGGKAYNECVVRVRKGDNTYLWCRISLMTIFDKGGNPCSVVGFIVDVDKEKKESENLQKMAEEDSLTKIYNKGTTESLISEFLEGEQNSDEIHAFLMIDIDNFKGINDTNGHIFGDGVLKDAAARIKRLFRATDIVGRIGGDEFAIFVKSAGRIGLIEDKAKALCDAFRGDYYEKDGYKISISIGVSVSPKDGKSYAELYKNADTALYISKKMGKDRYSFYSGEAPLDCTNISSSIDSEERETTG
ncbi:MAG: diguanylate cyclase [Oscillospiraceae bacterium]